jgi:hypothetical protein
MSWNKLRSAWVASVGAGFAGALLLGAFSCASLAGSPAVAGDDASVNQMTVARQKNLPYCSGGNRAKACVLGENCRVTEQGCQVCQCKTFED